MGCLSATVETIRARVSAACGRVQALISYVSVQPVIPPVLTYIEHIPSACLTLLSGITASVSANPGMSVQFGMVCTAAELKYLDVNPKKVRFFQGHLSEYVTILSNTIWHIK